MSRNLKVETIFLIRDARGLSASEKAALFVIESRGTHRSSVEVAAADAGLSVRGWQTVVRRLIGRGLVEAKEKRGAPTFLWINTDALKGCSTCTPAADAPPQEMHHPPQQLHPSPQEVHPSPAAGAPKGDQKETREGDPEGDHSAAAGPEVFIDIDLVADEADPLPVATPSSVRPNRFAGPCAYCAKPVEAGAGRLIGKEPAHLLDGCPVSSSTNVSEPEPVPLDDEGRARVAAMRSRMSLMLSKPA